MTSKEVMMGIAALLLDLDNAQLPSQMSVLGMSMMMMIEVQTGCDRAEAMEIIRIFFKALEETQQPDGAATLGTTEHEKSIPPTPPMGQSLSA